MIPTIGVINFGVYSWYSNWVINKISAFKSPIFPGLDTEYFSVIVPETHQVSICFIEFIIIFVPEFNSNFCQVTVSLEDGT